MSETQPRWPGAAGGTTQGALSCAHLTFPGQTACVHGCCVITQFSLFLLCKSFKLRAQSDLKGKVEVLSMTILTLLCLCKYVEVF